MENMELLKAMQEIMEANEPKKNAEMKADWEEMTARLEAKTGINWKEMKEEIKSGQAEMKSTVSAIEEKLAIREH
jgi:hypothetical protein